MSVELQSVTFRHRSRGVPAVSAVNLAVRPGESVGLIGPNGAGKSTLLGCVLGFLVPQAGTVTIDGVAPDSLSVRASVGALAEKPAFPAGMTARQALAFHHALLRLSACARREDVASLLARVGLGDAADRAPAGFSHGMRQRLGLAAALMGDPRLLVLDEPATGLDPPGVLLLRDEIRQARSRGATVILSSHQLDEVERSCERIVFMERGRVRADLPAGEIRAGTRTWRLRVLSTSGESPSPDTLAGIARSLGCESPDVEEGCLRLTMPGDEAAGRAITAIVAAGFVVTEAVPERSRLESFFRAESPS